MQHKQAYTHYTKKGELRYSFAIYSLDESDGTYFIKDVGPRVFKYGLKELEDKTDADTKAFILRETIEKACRNFGQQVEFNSFMRAQPDGEDMEKLSSYAEKVGISTPWNNQA